MSGRSAGRRAGPGGVLGGVRPRLIAVHGRPYQARRGLRCDRMAGGPCTYSGRRRVRSLGGRARWQINEEPIVRRTVRLPALCFCTAHLTWSFCQLIRPTFRFPCLLVSRIWSCCIIITLSSSSVSVHARWCIAGIPRKQFPRNILVTFSPTRPRGCCKDVGRLPRSACHALT